MSAFTYTLKMNAKPKTCTNWIIYFGFWRLNISKNDR